MYNLDCQYFNDCFQADQGKCEECGYGKALSCKSPEIEPDVPEDQQSTQAESVSCGTRRVSSVILWNPFYKIFLPFDLGCYNYYFDIADAMMQRF